MSRVYGIRSDGGYPAGAEFDSRAPWNQPPDKEVEVCVSVTYHGSFKVKVPPNYDETDLNEAVRNQITLPGDSSEVWFEDEMEVIEE